MKKKFKRFLGALLTIAVMFSMSVPTNIFALNENLLNPATDSIQRTEETVESSEIKTDNSTIDDTENAKKDEEKIKETIPKLLSNIKGTASEGGVLSLRGNDENGNVEAGDTANMKILGGPIYTFNAKVLDMNIAEGKKMTIELADGLRFSQTGAERETVTDNLVGAKVDTTPFNSIECWSCSDGQLSVSTSVNRGTQRVSGTIKENVTDFTWTFSVVADANLNYQDIKDAIKVTFEDEKGAKQVKSIDVLNTIWAADNYREAWGFTAIRGESNIPVPSKNIGAWQSRHYIADNTGANLVGNTEIRYELSKGVTMELQDGVHEGWSLTGGWDAEIQRNVYTLVSNGTKALKTNIAGGIYEPVEYVIDDDFDGTEYGGSYTKAAVKITKSFTNLKGEKHYTKTFNEVIRIIDKDPDVYVQYPQITTYLDSVPKHSDGTMSNTTYYPKDKLTYIGVYAMGNAGGTDSKEQLCELQFDDAVTVKAVQLIQCDSERVISSVSYQINGEDKWIEKSVTNKKNESWISTKELGISGNDRLTAIKYSVGEIPLNSHIGSGYIIGRLTDSSAASQQIGTAQVYNAEDEDTRTDETGTGKGIINSKPSNTNPFSISVPVNKTIKAGESVKLSFSLDARIREVMATDLAFYLMVPEGASISNFTASIGDVDVSDRMKLEKTESMTTSGDIYYRVDTSGLAQDTDGSLTGGWNAAGIWVNADPNAGRMKSNYLTFSYTLDTDETVQPGKYLYKDYVFGEGQNLVNKGNPNGFAEVRGLLFSSSSANTLTIEAKKGLAVSIKSKQEKQDDIDEAWNTYSRTGMPLPISSSRSNYDNVKVVLSNQVGALNSGSKVWIPIPKNDEDWGKATEGSYRNTTDNANSTAPFSILLKDYINANNIDTDVWEIEYGIGIKPVSEGDYSSRWDISGNNRADMWKTKDQLSTADIKNVNCIRLSIKTGKTVPPKSKSEIVFNVMTNDKDNGYTTLIKPIIYSDISDGDEQFASIDYGSIVAFQIATGHLSGQLYYDENRNGKFDEGEKAINGTTAGPDGKYTANLYRLGTSPRVIIDSSDVDSDGKYNFTGVGSGDAFVNYYGIEIINEAGGAHDFRTVNSGELSDNEMIVTKLGENNGRSSDNAFLHEDSGKAYCQEVSAVSDDKPLYTPEEGGVYNCGIVWNLKQLESRVTLTFKTSEKKGTLENKNRDDESPWITEESISPLEMSYSSVPTEKLNWPEVTEKEGYTFIGWKLADEHGRPVGEIIAQPSAAQRIGYENMTFIAQYEGGKTDIYYETEDEKKGSVSNQNDLDIDTFSGTPAGSTAVAKPGYEFDGWYDGKEKVSEEMTFIPEKSKDGKFEEKTYTARFKENKVTIRYVSDNEDMGFVENDEDTDINAVTGDPEGSTARPKPGYAFDGWYEGDKKVSDEMTMVPSKNDDGIFTDRNYVAKFVQKQYTVKYDLNGGEIEGNETLNDRTVTFNESGLIPGTPDNRDGYTFIGWKCDGRSADNADSYSEFVEDDNVNAITMTAFFRKNAETSLNGNESIQMTKSLSGKTPKKDEAFTFEITPEDADSPRPKRDTVTISTADGEDKNFEKYGLDIENDVTVAFSQIEFDQPGEYNYTVKEISGVNTLNYTYDDSVFTVKVSVIESADGTELSIDKISYEQNGESVSSIVFANAYKAEGTDTFIFPEVTKEVTGPVQADDDKEFSFKLESNDNEPLPDNDIVKITGNGTASFGSVAYSEEGEYEYTVKEEKKAYTGYVFDETVYTIRVIVEDAGGKIKVTDVEVKRGNDRAESIKFVNEYCPKPTTNKEMLSVNPSVRKKIRGDKPEKDSVFRFRLIANDTEQPMPEGSKNGMKEISISGEGANEFGIWNYEKVGEYKYSICEVNTGEKGYTFDNELYRITDEVTDINGTLKLKRTIMDSKNQQVNECKYVNTYKTSFCDKPGKVNKQKNTIDTLVKTGDPAKIGFAMFLFVIALAGVICSLTSGRRKNS